MLSVLQRLGYKPYQVVWELTLACNLNCRHCGSRAGTPRPDELTGPEALRLCKDLADLGTRRVTLGGGEPTLREDWPLITEALVSRGIRVNLLSNGRTWNRTLARRGKLFGLESVAFSLDGCEVTHEYIRRVPGQFEALLQAIDETVAEGLRVGVVTQLNRKNLAELEELGRILEAHGVANWQLQLGTPSGNMADHADLVLDPKDMLDMIPRIARLRKAGGRPRIHVGDNIGYYGPYEQDLRDQGGAIPFWIGCRAGLTVLGIESNGNIKGCLSLPSERNEEDRFVEGNIRQRSLKDIWEDPDGFAYNRKFTVDRLHGFCRTCDYAEACRGGCSWTSFSHTGACGGNPHCYHRVSMEQGRGGD